MGWVYEKDAAMGIRTSTPSPSKPTYHYLHSVWDLHLHTVNIVPGKCWNLRADMHSERVCSCLSTTYNPLYSFAKDNDVCDKGKRNRICY